MVTLRALRARAGQSLMLFATGVLVVAGCVAAAAYRGGRNNFVGAGTGLLLLGVVALAAEAVASVRSRREEIAVAALRGRYGVRLVLAIMSEPVLLLGGAGVAGTALGALVAAGSKHSAFLAAAKAGWLTALSVVALSVLTVTVVAVRGVARPLSELLAPRREPAVDSAATWFLQVLVLVGAVVAIYRVRSLGTRSPDWLTFVTPALLGLAAGQLCVWLCVYLSRLALRSPPLAASLGWYLPLRRFNRSSGSLSALRLVVAAAVMAGTAVTAQLRGSAWLDDSARIEAGGPVTFAVPAGGLQAYVASHRADPRGRWLMALSGSPRASGGSQSVFVDAARWRRVVGGFYAGTPVSAVTQHVGALSSGSALAWIRGRNAALTVSAPSLATLPTQRQLRRKERTPQGIGYVPLQFGVQYVNSDGASVLAYLPRSTVTAESATAGQVTFSTRLPDCSSACSVQDVIVQGTTRQGPLGVVALRFGSSALFPTSPGGPRIVNSKGVRVAATPSRLRLNLATPYTAQRLLTWSPAAPAPALVTAGERLASKRGHQTASGVDGRPRPISVAAQVAALPLVGADGVLLDLGTALRGAGPPIAGTRAFVVARSDTPPAVLERLRHLPVVGKRSSFASALRLLQDHGGPDRVQLYLLLAGFALLIAALRVVSAAVEQRRARGWEAASLRAAGVEVQDIETGYRREAVTLAGLVAAVTAVAVDLGCRGLLGVLPLVSPHGFQLPLQASPIPGVTLGVAAVSGGFIALVLYLSLRKLGRASPPSTLRIEEP